MEETVCETGCKWEDEIEVDLKEIRCETSAGFRWLRIETTGSLHLPRQKTLLFHKRLEIFGQLRKRNPRILYSMEVVNF
jgi:hypothetical protein